MEQVNATMTVEAATTLILDAQNQVHAAVATLEARRSNLLVDLARLEDEITGLKGVLGGTPTNGNGNLKCPKCDRTFKLPRNVGRHVSCAHPK